MYHIEKVSNRALVIITFEGAYDFDQSAFEGEIKDAVTFVRSAEKSFDILADWSKISVMDQGRAGESHALAAWFIAAGLRRSANVLTSITQRMQLKRVTEGDERFGYFATKEEALAWLSE